MAHLDPGARAGCNTNNPAYALVFRAAQRCEREVLGRGARDAKAAHPMKARYGLLCFTLPFALYAGGCSSAAGGSSCPVDPQCYVVSAGGECSVDPSAVCSAGTWACSAEGKLGSGCMPDGGIAPPPVDAGACPLASLDPPLACSSDATCAPYGGHCEYDAFTGAGSCACGASQQDACVLDCYGDVCLLPSFTLTCSGPNDTTCQQYDALCVAASAGAPGSYVCECVATDPPHGAGMENGEAP
ncbi:MAG TPA: hypothetical protein VGG39_36840 [Polyangiaceae bacterium]